MRPTSWPRSANRWESFPPRPSYAEDDGCRICGPRQPAVGTLWHVGRTTLHDGSRKRRAKPCKKRVLEPQSGQSTRIVRYRASLKLKRLKIGIDVALGFSGIVSVKVLSSSPQKEASDENQSPWSGAPGDYACR